MPTRRQFLALSGAAAVTALTTGRGGTAHAENTALAANTGAPAAGSPPYLGLVTSLTDEHSYRARVEGRLPPELRGALYINGPGLFERNGFRKRTALDGDGMITAFQFGDAGVVFRNRFVRTAKFVEEETAGAFRYASWTTRKPGGWLANVGLAFPPAGGQAGVSARVWNGRLYAFDESTPPTELHPQTLETLGLSELGAENGRYFSAHPKMDLRRGEWLHFGVKYGPTYGSGYGPGSILHLDTVDRAGKLLHHRTLRLPRDTYLHDWFVSERHFLFNLHPVEPGYTSMLAGFNSFAGSFTWKPDKGSLLMLLERDGDAEPVFIETEAAWMWHSLNAYERGNELIADFVGYDDPDHFVGEDPALARIMTGDHIGITHPGTVRRYRIDLAAHRVRTEQIAGDAYYEFPIVPPQQAGYAHRYGYFSFGPKDEALWTGVARMDMESGQRDAYDFGPRQYALEPVFVPHPSRSASAEREPGWLLTLVYDGDAGRSHLAVLNAERVADGPVARVLLEHAVPIRFHGQWVQAG
jgi:all-trans-8'-apo-beta-carotenal 15,15'-oxygenase